MTELLTAAEMGRRLRVSAATIKLWARDGKIPRVIITPKVHRFDPEAVEAALCHRDRARGEGAGDEC